MKINALKQYLNKIKGKKKCMGKELKRDTRKRSNKGNFFKKFLKILKGHFSIKE